MFSPGLDLWKLLDGGGPYVEKLLVELSDGLRRLFTLPVPVVAAVNGHAIAGGCIIAAACDHRVMTDVPSARIGIPEFRVGVPFPTVPLEIMRELVPHHHLRSLVLGGATVDPTRAVELRRREVARREVPRGGRCHPFRERRPRREVPDSRNDSRNGWHLGQGRPQPPAEATDAAPSAAFTRFTRLTNQAGLESSPALSPDGELVAYVAFDGDDRDVFLLRVGGQKPINLTEDSPADEQCPAFSPDGRSIAFRSERDGGGLFVMGATSESVRRLTDFGDNPLWGDPAALWDLCYNLAMDTTIRNLDPEAYRHLKAHAALQGMTIGEAMSEAIRAYLSRKWPAPGSGTLADWKPEPYPPGNERLSEEIDRIVYGA
jgi:hypothetical protein